MTEQQESISSDEIDLRQVFKVLSKWKKVIALITFVSVLTSGIVSYFMLKPVYESKAMLMVTAATSDKQGVTNNNDNLESVISTVSRIPQLTMNTYVNQFKSEVLFQRVAENLSLNSEIYSPAALSGITSAIVLKDSNLIELKVQHSDPGMAARIGNAISDQYLGLISENNQSKMSRSVGFLEDQREKVEKELDEVLEKLKVYESQPGGVAFLEQQFKTKNEDLSKYQSMLNEARVDMRQAEAGMQSVSEELEKTPKTIIVKKINELNLTEIVSEEANPLYISLSQEYAAKTTRVSELQAKMGVMSAITGEIRQDVDQIQKALVERKDEMERLGAEKERLVNARNLLAEKVTQTQIASSINLGDTSVVVVSPSMVPSSPIKPNKKLNIAIAFVLGLIMAVMVAFLMEYMDNTIKSPKEVTDKLNAPLLGTIPYVANNNANTNI